MEPEPLDEIDAYVGRRIETLRRAREMTEDHLASRLGLDPSGLRAMEAGRVKVFTNTLVSAARVLRVNVAELLPPSTH